MAQQLKALVRYNWVQREHPTSAMTGHSGNDNQEETPCFYSYRTSWYEYSTRTYGKDCQIVKFEMRFGCVKIFLVRPSVRHIPKNLKRRSPFIFFLRGVGGSARGFFRN